MSLRGRFVGVDTKYYCNTFVQFRDIKWKNVFNSILYADPTRSRTFIFDFEPGYRLFNKVVSCVSSSPQAIIVATSVLILTLVLLWVLRDSPYVMLSIWLYLTLGIYQTEMNVSRNAIAIMIVFLSLKYIEEEQPLKYILCILFASMFHQTVIVFIPIYFLIRLVSIKIKRMLFFTVICGYIGLNIQRFAGILSRFLPYKYARYLWRGNDNLLSILVGVFGCALFFLIWFFMEREEREHAINGNQIGCWLLTLNLCFFGINLGVEAGARMAALFGPYLICLIPRMLSEVKNDDKRKMLIMLVAVISLLQYIVRLKINNIGGTMPYVFFWNQI